jgi:hypothetical protein
VVVVGFGGGHGVQGKRSASTVAVTALTTLKRQSGARPQSLAAADIA